MSKCSPFGGMRNWPCQESSIRRARSWAGRRVSTDRVGLRLSVGSRMSKRGRTNGTVALLGSWLGAWPPNASDGHRPHPRRRHDTGVNVPDIPMSVLLGGRTDTRTLRMKSGGTSIQFNELRLFTKCPQSTASENTGPERTLLGLKAPWPVNSPRRITLEYNENCRPTPAAESGSARSGGGDEGILSQFAARVSNQGVSQGASRFPYRDCSTWL